MKGFDDLFNGTPTLPKVWIERVELFESIEQTAFRKIPLKPGLNIVWAEEEDGEDENNILFLGHGVGKTSFCRLLRYCLSEKYYAPRLLRERILKEFPDGYVAATVWIDGIKWGVAKPFDSHKRSYYLKDCDMDFSLKKDQYSSKEEYLEALRFSIFGDSEPMILPGSGQIVSWEHILSWCTRDQETHLDNFSFWRALRSESESPSFKWPTKDPVEMVRFCLGYIDSGEQKLQVECQRLEKEIEKLQVEVDKLSQQPKFFFDELSSRLRNKLNIPDRVPVSSTQGDFISPSLIEIAKARVGKNKSELDKKRSQLLEADSKRLEANANVSRIKDEIDKLEGVRGIAESQKLDIEKGIQKYQKLENTINNPKEFCIYGNIAFKKCEYMINHKTYFQLGTRRQKNENEAAYQKRLAIINRQNDRIKEKNKELLESQQKFESLSRILNDREIGVRTLEFEKGALENEISELNKYNDILSGKNENSGLVKSSFILKTKKFSLTRKQDLLRLAKAKQVKKVGVINGYLDKFSGNVFPGLHGRVVLDDVARPFQLFGPGGEAFHVLEVILGDIVSAISALSHPGFIIHDSPREADMGDNLYRGYFRMLISLGRAMRKNEVFPMQYIVATTTMPIDGDGEEEFICLKLHAKNNDGMLFKTKLHDSGFGLVAQ